MMGIQTSSREPGITVQNRQETGIAVLYCLFDNFREFKANCARVLVPMIQQYVDEAEIIRINGEKGVQLMQINTQINPQMEGFNDITFGEYDIELEENLDTGSARSAILKILADWGASNPGTIPPDVMFEYANVPFTSKQKIREYQARASAVEQQKVEREYQLKVRELDIKEMQVNGQIEAQRKAALNKPQAAKRKERKDG